MPMDDANPMATIPDAHASLAQQRKSGSFSSNASSSSLAMIFWAGQEQFANPAALRYGDGITLRFLT
jgi:hypothetical protein